MQKTYCKKEQEACIRKYMITTKALNNEHQNRQEDMTRRLPTHQDSSLYAPHSDIP